MNGLQSKPSLRQLRLHLRLHPAPQLNQNLRVGSCCWMGKIENEKQLELTKGWIIKFSETWEEMKKEECPKDVHPRIYQASIDAVYYQLEDLKQQVRDYEQTQQGQS